MTSSAAKSSATTRAPWRASSKAWRPKPAPASRTRSPRPTPSAARRAERTVSTSSHPAVATSLVDVRRHRQDLAVLLDGLLGAASPRPALEDPLAAGRADAGPELGFVEAAGDGRRQRLGVTGRARQDGVAVASGDLREGPAVGGHEGGARDHRFDRREAEPLVEAGHDRQLGLGVELDDPLVGDTGDEVDVGEEAERADEVHALAVARLADDRQRDVAL